MSEQKLAEDSCCWLGKANMCHCGVLVSGLYALCASVGFVCHDVDRVGYVYCSGFL